ncbi:MAG: MBOAT family protein [Lachnospiraceae bacterium]|nr:MBOAT family protein [Lachnospiraceae bacterium]
MAFYSVAFFGFVFIFVILHGLICDIAPKRQWIVRLLASLTFFLYLSGLKIVFLLLSTFTIWGGALLISRIDRKDKEHRSGAEFSKEEKKALKKKSQRKQKWIVAAIILVNLLLLFFSKYLLPLINHPIALPIGISFYTLQAISYTVDVYGKKYEPEQNPAKVLLYLCWFPQLIQGPINRFDSVREDLFKTYKLHAPQFRFAFYMFLFGAVKKYAIADLLAPMVNASLNNQSAAYPGSFLTFGAVMYAIEQYADFSGGIDMSMAISLLFGVRMDKNFNQPYFATSLAEFWRRWHMTLGGFMRDYVFYPFVTTKPVSTCNKIISKRFGNHAGRALIGGISNLLVFALVGLWHGPEKHYLFWGLYNGLIIAVSDAIAPLFAGLKRFSDRPVAGKFLYGFRIFRTFMIVVFAGYFDVIGSVRTGLGCFANTLLRFDLSEGLSMIAKLFTEDVTSVGAVIAAGIAILMLLVNSIFKERGRLPLRRASSDRYYLRWVICFTLIGVLLYSFTVSSGIRGFMYAAF